MSYKKALALLEEYGTVHGHKLARAAYWRHGTGCAIGAIWPAVRDVKGQGSHVLVLVRWGAHTDAELLYDTGLTINEAVALQHLSDGYAGDEAERYRTVHVYLLKRVSAEGGQ